MRATVLVTAAMRFAAREEVCTSLLGRSRAAAVAITKHQARAPEALPTPLDPTTPLQSGESWLLLSKRCRHASYGGE